MSLLLEAVQRRKRYLRRLRAWDYNKFCWVLEQLNIDYIMLGNLIRTTRKDIAQGLVQKQALEIRRDKFKAYHEQLKAKQGDFLVRQERELAEISEEEKVLLAELKSLKNKKDVVVQ
jgi:small subunit ribosomal protein S15